MAFTKRHYALEAAVVLQSFAEFFLLSIFLNIESHISMTVGNCATREIPKIFKGKNCKRSGETLLNFIG